MINSVWKSANFEINGMIRNGSVNRIRFFGSFSSKFGQFLIIVRLVLIGKMKKKVFAKYLLDSQWWRNRNRLTISSPERETFLSTFFRAVCKMDKNLTCYCNIFILFSAMWVEHSQNAIIGSKLRSIRSPSSSCVAALESKEIGMEWSKWHTWATIAPIFKNFYAMNFLNHFLKNKYFKKCNTLSH